MTHGKDSNNSPLTDDLGSILIVAVTKVEVQAVLKAFTLSPGKPTRLFKGGKPYYELGIHSGAKIFLVQSEMGTATVGGALMTIQKAIHDLKPLAIIMCGIAFGLHPDKQQLGDILIAKQLQQYELQKVDLKQGKIRRGDRVTVSEQLLGRFRDGDNDWQEVKTHFGLILSGEKLVNDPVFRNGLLEMEPEAVGGEMEGSGLYIAARNAGVDWILVKAICDWADGNKNDGAQQLAAENAAKFVLHVVELGGWGTFETTKASSTTKQTHLEELIKDDNRRSFASRLIEITKETLLPPIGNTTGAIISKLDATLCDYNGETTSSNNLGCRAEEKMDVSEQEW